MSRYVFDIINIDTNQYCGTLELKEYPKNNLEKILNSKHRRNFKIRPKNVEYILVYSEEPESKKIEKIKISLRILIKDKILFKEICSKDTLNLRDIGKLKQCCIFSDFQSFRNECLSKFKYQGEHKHYIETKDVLTIINKYL